MVLITGVVALEVRLVVFEGKVLRIDTMGIEVEVCNTVVPMGTMVGVQHTIRFYWMCVLPLRFW